MALKALYAQAPGAKALGEKAKAVLVFPSIYKGALLVGGQGGKGAMFQDGRIAGHYKIGGVALGLEGGAQIYSYALFFVVLNAALTSRPPPASGMSYGYVYNASGLMGGVSLQGLKITKISK